MIEFMCWQVGAWKKFSTRIFTGKTLLFFFFLYNVNLWKSF